MPYHQTHETEIIARLAPIATAGTIVAAIPESQQEAQRVPVGPSQAKVYVGYAGTDYDNTQNQYAMRSTAEMQQDEYHKYEIVLISTKLRGPQGIYALIDAVKTRLFGFRLSSVDRLHIRETGFIERDTEKGVYQYMIIFACKGMMVEVSEEEQLPLLKKVLYNEEFPQNTE